MGESRLPDGPGDFPLVADDGVLMLGLVQKGLAKAFVRDHRRGPVLFRPRGIQGQCGNCQSSLDALTGIGKERSDITKMMLRRQVPHRLQIGACRLGKPDMNKAGHAIPFVLSGFPRTAGLVYGISRRGARGGGGRNALRGRVPCRITPPAPRRGAGVVERGGLENRCTPCGYRGFESHPLRHLFPGAGSAARNRSSPRPRQTGPVR